MSSQTTPSSTGTQPVPLPAALLERYRLDAELGRGSMGVVYRAFDTRLARQVALKVLYPLRAKGEDLKHMEERFLREARLAARLVHPNIVTVFDIVQDVNQWILVMELVEGRTLRQILQEDEGLPVGRAADWILQAARALECAHQGGVIHRDIKPENLMLQRGGRIRIMDFGVAMSLDSPRLTAVGQTMGTPAYFAPELLKGGHPNARSDLFSLGVLFYELVAGYNPYAGGSVMQVLARIATSTPPDLATVCPYLPPLLSDMVQRLMHPDPEQRYGSAQEFIEELELLALARNDLVEEGMSASTMSATTLSGRITVADLRATLAAQPNGLFPAMTPVRSTGIPVRLDVVSDDSSVVPGAVFAGVSTASADAEMVTATASADATFQEVTPSAAGTDGVKTISGALSAQSLSGQPVVPETGPSINLNLKPRARFAAAMAGLCLLVGGGFAVSGMSGGQSSNVPVDRALEKAPVQMASAGLPLKTASASGPTAINTGQGPAQALAPPGLPSGQSSGGGGSTPPGPDAVAGAPVPPSSETVAVALASSAGAGGLSTKTVGMPGATAGGPGVTAAVPTATASMPKATGGESLPFDAGLSAPRAIGGQSTSTSGSKPAPAMIASPACATLSTRGKELSCLEKVVASAPTGARFAEGTQKQVKSLLSDPASQKRAIALAARILPKDALIKQLRSVLKSSSDYDIREQAAKALAANGAPVSVVERKRLDLFDAECPVRREAAYYFRDKPSKNAKDDLEKALSRAYVYSEVTEEVGFFKVKRKVQKRKENCDYVPLKEALERIGGKV